jgi:hypothetical protein
VEIPNISPVRSIRTRFGGRQTPILSHRHYESSDFGEIQFVGTAPEFIYAYKRLLYTWDLCSYEQDS